MFVSFYWALYEKADNNIQSIVETIAGNVRVVRLREEPAKRRPALAWIPSLLRWGLGRQVSERFIVLFTWFDRFDHLHFAGATSSRSASLSRWRSSKRCGILRALPSRIRLSSVTTWGLASAGKVRTKCFNDLPFVNKNLFLSQWTCTSRRHLSMDGGCLELRWPQIPEGTEQFRWKDPEEKWQTEVELNNFRIIFSTRTCWLMEPLPTIGVAELAERSAS